MGASRRIRSPQENDSHLCTALGAAGCASLLLGVCRVRACPGGLWAPARTRLVSGREHSHCARLGGPRALRPPPLPPLQTFSQLPDQLHSAPRSASLMNYSAARVPISAPGPPDRAGAGGGFPRPPGAPPSPARRLPAQSQPGPAPAARPRSAVSLPPALSPLGLPPSLPARSAFGPAARAAPVQGGGETARGRPTPSQPGRDPEAPEGPPTPATSLSAPAQRVPCKDAPRLPAFACGGDAGPHLGATARYRARPHGPTLRPQPRVARGESTSTRSGGVQTWGG